MYNPPSCFLTNPLKSVLSDLSIKYKIFLTVGDFNINLLKVSQISIKFKKILSFISLNLCSNEPTNFVTDKIPSQIDYVLVKNQQLIKTCSQLAFGSFTSHDLIFGSYLFDISYVNSSTEIFFRNFKNVNTDCFLKLQNLILIEFIFLIILMIKLNF